MPKPRIGVLVVAYNAAATLETTLNRLPQSFIDRLDHILVADDASTDETYDVGVRVRNTSQLPMTVIKHSTNLGYGGNQKHGYRWAIQHGLDIVVLLHGDGQYAPESIEHLVKPLESGAADAVFGSRMMNRGEALKGGMPLYKYVGNRILTTFQNAMTGLRLTEWHSGYRAYRVDALQDIDFDSYSDVFDFDTEIILGLHSACKHIAEVPIPTFYGDEICYVNGMKYAKDVTIDVIRHRLHQIGFFATSSTPRRSATTLRLSPRSIHGTLLNIAGSRPAGSVLDFNCGDGSFAALLAAQGHHVTGVNPVKIDGVADKVKDFIEADPALPLPPDLARDYHLVVAADVLPTVPDPERLLTELSGLVHRDGRLVVSVPNIGHWYPRLRIVLGRFGYDENGPLNRNTLRFFGRHSADQLIASVGLTTVNRFALGAPYGELSEHSAGSFAGAFRRASRVESLLARWWPSLFAYHFVYELAHA